MTDAVETILCTNCKREILSSNFVIHDVHCQRNIYICSKCNEPVNRFQKDEHEESHVLVFCTSCHTNIEKYLLTDHMINDCPHRKIKCQICDIEIGALDLSEHENYCGARTEKCSECGEFVMLKYKQLHLDSNHTFLKLSDEPGPSPSWQNGRRTLGNFFPDLDLINHTPQLRQKKKYGRNDNSRHRAKGSPEVEKVEKSFKGLSDQNGKQESSSYQRDVDCACSSRTHEYKRPDTNETESKRSIRKYGGSSFEETRFYNHYDIDSYGYLKSDKGKTSKKGKANSSRYGGCSSKQMEESFRTDNEKKGKSRDTSGDTSLDLTVRLSEDFNGDFQADDKLIAQAIEENTAVLSEFSLFDSLDKNNSTAGVNLSKNIYSGKKHNKTSTKQHLTSLSDDSSDDELLLYAKNVGNNKVDVSVLPCQFCGALFPCYTLMSHQKLCESFADMGEPHSYKYNKKRSSSSGDKEGVIPCEMCSRLIPFSRYSSHVGEEKKNNHQKRKNQKFRNMDNERI